MSRYSDLLKHPKWQKKRLEILEQHNFQCKECGDSESTLHVHHGYYEKDKDPWDYPDYSLHCLCENCHEEIQGRQDVIKKLIGSFGTSMDLDRIEGYMMGIIILNNNDQFTAVLSTDQAEGIGDFLHIDSNVIFQASLISPVMSLSDLEKFDSDHRKNIGQK
jgi:hypothetical protein